MIYHNIIKNNIVFFGTAEFAVPALQTVHQAGYRIIVITTPDAPAGRHRVLIPSPVKLTAQKLGLQIFQPSNLKIEALKNCLEIRNWKLEIGIVAAYGKIIPAGIINLFPFGILNVHPSLLPKYRGPSPIQYALLNGDAKTGVTIIKIDEEIDHGPVVGVKVQDIGASEKYEELQEKLAKLGAELLVKILPDYLAGKVKLKEQEHDRATFTKIIKKDDGKIDWRKSARQVYNQFRAFHKWPGVWMTWQNKILKLTAIDTSAQSYKSIYIGKMRTEAGKIIIPCLNQSIKVLSLQLSGGKPMTAKEFINGYGKLIGEMV